MIRRLNFEYGVRLRFDTPVKQHAFVLRFLPPEFPGQAIPDVALQLEPAVPVALQKDGFGNLLQIGLIQPEHSSFFYSVRGTAVLDPDALCPSPALPVFRYPSPYTDLSAEMREFLASLSLPESPEARAEALCLAVHGRIRYTPGQTGISTRASEAFAAGHGVCQDFAHIYCALARASGLTVRYVNGLPEGEGASHAWCEVHLNGIWRGIDPTRGIWCNGGYIRFNTGRDYGDCPMERGVFTGCTHQRQSITMRVSAQ